MSNRSNLEWSLSPGRQPCFSWECSCSGAILLGNPKHAWTRRGLHTSSNELEVMAKITTFLVVFVAIFCGWPCLLHFMAGEAIYSSSPFHLFERGRLIFISLMWLVQVLQGRGQFSPQLPVVSSSSPACSSGSVLVRFDLSRFSHCWFSDSVFDSCSHSPHLPNISHGRAAMVYAYTGDTHQVIGQADGNTLSILQHPQSAIC